jgi:membrane protease YdiL (CAAX protease family)
MLSLFYLAPALTGHSLDSIGLDSSNPKALLPLYWLSQGVMQICIFVIPALIFLYYYDFNHKGNPLTRLRGVPVAVYGLTPLLAAGLLPLAYSLHEWNQSLHLPPALAELEDAWRASEQQTEQIIKAFLSASGAQALLLNVVVLVLLPALGEELIFRGIVQRIFMRWIASPHVAIWICGALFSAIHMQWLGFFPRWLLGVELGYLAWFTGSLWPAVLSHATHNALSIWMAKATEFSEESKNGSEVMSVPLMWVVGGLALAGVTALAIYKLQRKRELSLDRVHS